MRAARLSTARRALRSIHASTMSPLVAAIQKLSPRTPLMSAACDSAGTPDTESPSGSHGNASGPMWSSSSSEATQITGSRTASGSRVVRRAAESTAMAAATTGASTRSDATYPRIARLV